MLSWWQRLENCYLKASIVVSWTCNIPNFARLLRVCWIVHLLMCTQTRVSHSPFFTTSLAPVAPYWSREWKCLVSSRFVRSRRIEWRWSWWFTCFARVVELGRIRFYYKLWKRDSHILLATSSTTQLSPNAIIILGESHLGRNHYGRSVLRFRCWVVEQS